ncbi:MAG TPA: NAD(P)/FAD-dependent oxidoreductase [Opitutaceae bacterium]|jgi:monoamine oxidase|nr:NAD(P)/FAD-dependent oxidoreductase [Opitutaceae bacterium]
MKAARADVVVIGAGVAGLAAAGRLAAEGLDVMILEARSRIGGRIASVRDPDWPVPVELGAEFIHGGNAALRAALRRAGLRPRPLADEHREFLRGRFRPRADLWGMVERAAARIPDLVGPGASVNDFLRRADGQLSPSDRLMLRSFVEGFEGAPLGRMSAAALADEDGGGAQYRMPQGYDRLAAAMAADLERRKAPVLLHRAVRRIAWRPGRVEIEARDTVAGGLARFAGRAAVITLPLGVLRARPPAAGAIAFAPALADRDRLLERLRTGHALRVSLRFEPEFWRRKILPRLGAGFVHTDDPGIAVWWSLAPAPALVAWAGGPRAERLGAWDAAALLSQVLRSLRRVAGVGVPALRRALADARYHNWLADPYARGSYSYAEAGLEDAPARLGRPVEETLFFAGEATAAAHELGTVHGALASGLRAADEVIRSRTSGHRRRPAPSRGRAGRRPATRRASSAAASS